MRLWNVTGGNRHYLRRYWNLHSRHLCFKNRRLIREICGRSSWKCNGLKLCECVPGTWPTLGHLQHLPHNQQQANEGAERRARCDCRTFRYRFARWNFHPVNQTLRVQGRARRQAFLQVVILHCFCESLVPLRDRGLTRPQRQNLLLKDCM